MFYIILSENFDETDKVLYKSQVGELNIFTYTLVM